jgi:hypothetical protein
MSTSQQLGCEELNNRGVIEGMRSGDLLLAVRHFKAALELASTSLLTHRPSSNPFTASTAAVFGSSAFLPVESEVDQEPSFYNSDPIIMIMRGPAAYTNEDTDDPVHIVIISSAIIIYNMALTYHKTTNGQSASQIQFLLLKATQLYEKAVLFLAPIYDLQQGLLAASCRMVVTASLHNLKQIRFYDELEGFCSPSGASAA